MFQLRQSKETDKNFIYSSWLKCYLVESPLTKYIKPNLFFRGQHAIIDKLFARPGLQIRIACAPDDEDIIYGYLVYEPEIIHFIYVKEAFRKMGVGSKLLTSLGDHNTFQISHVTKTLLDLWTSGEIKCGYNPYFEMGIK